MYLPFTPEICNTIIFSDVKNWLSAYSLVGKELWIVRNAEGRPDGSGFIVFDHHDDAVKAGSKVVLIDDLVATGGTAAAGALER